MTLVAVAAGKGSPGVTTAAQLLAAVWPALPLLAECDPSGADAPHRAGRGAVVTPDRGLVSLAAQAAAGQPRVGDHVQRLPGGLPVLVGPATPGAAAALGAGWSRVAQVLAGLPGGDVIADCGRVVPGPATAVPRAAATVALVVRPSVAGVTHLRAAVRFFEQSDRLAAGGPLLVVVPVATGRRDTTAAAELAQVVAQERWSVRVTSALAWDPSSAAALAAGRGPGDRSPLVRSARQVAELLARWTPSAAARAARAPAAEPTAAGVLR